MVILAWDFPSIVFHIIYRPCWPFDRVSYTYLVFLRAGSHILTQSQIPTAPSQRYDTYLLGLRYGLISDRNLTIYEVVITLDLKSTSKTIHQQWEAQGSHVPFRAYYWYRHWIELFILKYALFKGFFLAFYPVFQSDFIAPLGFYHLTDNLEKDMWQYYSKGSALGLGYNGSERSTSTSHCHANRTQLLNQFWGDLWPADAAGMGYWMKVNRRDKWLPLFFAKEIC